jgi:hypothetical protein
VVKLLFLDVDGVANSSRSVFVKLGPTVETSELVRQLQKLDEPDETELEFGVSFGLKTIDPVCVALINKLIAADPQIGLVLSSTHRKFLWNSKAPYGSDTHLARLRLYLTAMGFTVPSFFSVTPVLHKRRGDEIDAWLNHAYENGFYDDDDRYVILDDSADMLPGQPLVLCDATQGFSFENYSEACRHLGVNAPGLILL